MIAPSLETPRLILRAHRLSDFEDMAAFWADEAVTRFIQGAPQTREATWTRLLRYAGHWTLLGFGYWVVTAKEDGRFVGEVGFADYLREMAPSIIGRPEAGWAIRSADQGKGFATEAVSRIAAWADTALLHDTTVCIIKPTHDASQNIARKVGYRLEAEGVYRDAPTLVMARPRATSASP